MQASSIKRALSRVNGGEVACPDDCEAGRGTGTLAAQVPQMRVLYDVSTLGLAHLYQQSRGGSFRVDLHMAEALAASSECELLFCANHSTVAYHGCETFLRGH